MAAGIIPLLVLLMRLMKGFLAPQTLVAIPFLPHDMDLDNPSTV